MEVHEHLDRHRYHLEIGLTLAGTEAGHAWGCVAAFYSAYHAVKFALRRDERFDDLSALKAINAHLQPDDRYAEWHRARKGSNRFGISELVALMYPAAAGPYDKLHQASIEVRYQQGRLHLLPPADRLESYLTQVYDIVVGTAVKDSVHADTSE